MLYFNMNLQQGLYVNRTLFNNEIKNIKTGVYIKPSGFKISCFNFCSAMKKSYYASILLKTYKGTAKTIYKHSTIAIVQSGCKYGLSLSCSSSGFSPAQQTFWRVRQLPNTKMKFLRHFYTIPYFFYLQLERKVIRNSE